MYIGELKTKVQDKNKKEKKTAALKTFLIKEPVLE